MGWQVRLGWNPGPHGLGRLPRLGQQGEIVLKGGWLDRLGMPGTVSRLDRVPRLDQ